MKRSLFKLFITSRKLTGYLRKACQRDIGFNFASKEVASATPVVQYSWFSLQCQNQADRLYKDTRDVKEARRFNRVTERWGSSSRSQVLLNGFLLPYIWAGCREHLSRTHRHFVSPQSPCQSNVFWHVGDDHQRLPLKMCAHTGMGPRVQEHERVRPHLCLSMGKQGWRHVYF